MLAMTRKTGESILIGDDIVLTILAIRGDKVRIGIAAPIELQVDRPEVRAGTDAAVVIEDDGTND